jgi:Lon protease-like protein
MSDIPEITWSEPIPLFPLPNCVLLPGVALPLLVFEPRYRTMVRDVLAEDLDRIMAVALLRPGYEDLYHTNQAPVFPVVGVGTIYEHEELDDGRYTLVLRGLARASISVEDKTGPYRKAVLVPRESNPLPDGQAVEQARQSLRDLLDQAGSLGAWPEQATDRIFEAFPVLEQLIDVVTFHTVPSDEITTKQRVLEEPRVDKRLAILSTFLQQVIAMQRYATWTKPSPETWPPPNPTN